MKRFILLFLMAINGNIFAQQEAIYSQYMFNQFVINPAYAGSRNSMSAVILHRSRWTGMDGSPTTSTFSVHSGVKNSNLAWGANFASDKLGVTSNTFFAASGAYHVRMTRGKLAFGLRIGAYNSSINTNTLDFKDKTDIFNIGESRSSLTPSADFGVYYYTRKFYVGFSLNHMGNREIEFDDFSDATFNLSTYATLGLGYAMVLNDNLTLKPSFLLKNTTNTRANLDLNLSALIYDRVWLGVSFRNQSNINFLIDVNITDYLRIGYSYDSFINKLNSVAVGAHEVFVGFDFAFNKPKTVSPRYL
ncbi:PorP/SprF family type IX secretion system membrane protein [Crocinitomix algicola]|uniref:PorP/SprF family type IX secretion system membrane protein n=1 Tax=Crocinitomix algicola TaxID=1740263 RepID=UPI0009F5C1D1|nr:type IX secretion system membrane protein PorP/SprF [Crocinitomix algicola]